ncbi:hypothetical protein RRG08_027609 [Elysia crispata]|uniref:Uncharacterized protein n=1 Tax=Elysia crispata TaxID=231223 RepID=A0AAE1AF07_9GAST|nr:hypothetical protein RRG08_027609 [Elysia crispata]
MFLVLQAVVSFNTVKEGGAERRKKRFIGNGLHALGKENIFALTIETHKVEETVNLPRMINWQLNLLLAA